ncbi:MAG: DUF4276 family protein [Bacteroidetes bacterium]|nr:DUF4276 family protein [Bacteroidota bacterium]
MVKEKILIIEGALDNRSGILRQGFNKLLAQKLEGKMPRIIMGEGKKQSIGIFLNYKSQRIPHLLIDLDNRESFKNQDLKDNNLFDKSDVVYYMIQEMESWFLSQPKILDKYYSAKLSVKIPNKHPKEISNPSDFLYQITKLTKKGKYHKVKHAVDLLRQLSTEQLMLDFEDFNKLIYTLNN